LEERRKQAIELLIIKRCGVRETARRVYASPSSVIRWRNAYQQYGQKALDSKTPSSRPCRLTQKQLQKLQVVLLKKINADNNKTLFRSLREIAQIIRKRFGIRYQPSSIWYILSRLGWRHKKAKGKAYWFFNNYPSSPTLRRTACYVGQGLRADKQERA
ncbi:MAG: winged helix-turn-helix domain-containing protein, partial [Planctomycetes bacterium]|nr:winged helix-turn-helix domain-containing protein [Planctomycetota bacterium]MBU1518958.1 winged helix-turn-helix domain-containing protein [Planctomycetota bacterium]